MPLPVNIQRSRRNLVGLWTPSRALLDFAEALTDAQNETRPRQFTDTERAKSRDHMVSVLLDLLSAVETTEDLWVGYSRGKANFVRGGPYWNEELDKPFFSQAFFLGTIDFLADIGLVENFVQKAGYTPYSSRMRATNTLIAEFKALGVDWTCVVSSNEAPIIIVKDENRKITKWPDPGQFDLDDAIRNLRRINENLEDTFINLNISDEDLRTINWSRSATVDEEDNEDFIERSPVDFSQRQLRRVFALNSFSSGGRFYGGWWQGIPSPFRKHIEINRAVTVELDFSTLQPRILYASVDLKPPKDSYLVPGWPENIRSVTKKLFSQLINSDETSRNPNQWHRFAPDFDPSPIPNDWHELNIHKKDALKREAFIKKTGRDYDELIHDLLQFHAPIQKDFFSKAWGATQNLDSQIVERVLIKLLELEIPETALPIHDSFIVRRGAEKILEDIMHEAFNEVIQTEAKIDRDETVFDRPDGYEGPSVIVADSELQERVKRHLETHRGYHVREHQWMQTWGPL